MVKSCNIKYVLLQNMLWKLFYTPYVYSLQMVINYAAYIKPLESDKVEHF